MEDNLDRLVNKFEKTLKDQEKTRALVEERGQDAQGLLDELQLLADHLADHPRPSSPLRSSLVVVMRRLVQRTGLYPTSLLVQNVQKLGDGPVVEGRYGEVWRGKIRVSNQTVCLKKIRVTERSDLDQVWMVFLQEAILWRQMKHPNVTPFLGIHCPTERQLYLISSWMDEGNLRNYLKSTPREKVDHYTLAYDVANGLDYLHSNGVVHGNLKDVNILITRSHRACIGGFGSSHVAASLSHDLGLSVSQSGLSVSLRWLAPELVKGERISEKSDIYTYGSVCYEIFTGLLPYYDLTHEGAIVRRLIKGIPPSRPKDESKQDEFMWKIMESCWNQDSSPRPNAAEILEDIKRNKPGLLFPCHSEFDSL